MAMASNKAKVKVGLWMPCRTLDRLKRVAEVDFEDGKTDFEESVSETIRKAVYEYLERREGEQ